MSAASDVGSAVEKAFGFLAEHKELISLVAQALEGGATSHDLAAAIKREMTAAADKQMHAELGE